MKLACVAPDDLSTIIFCQTLCAVARDTGAVEVTTFSPVGLFESELASLHSTHVPVSMERFLAPWRDLKYLLKLARHLGRNHFDAVITFTTKPNIYGVVAAKLAGVPKIILAVRGLGRTFDKHSTLAEYLMRLLVSQLYRVSCALCTEAWFTNPNDVKYFVGHKIVQPQKVFVTKNAVNLSVFRPATASAERMTQLRRDLGLDDKERVVIMVARLVWSKGIKEFVEAAELLRARLPCVRFLLVAPPESKGPGAVPEIYLRIAEKKPNFTWLGFRKDVVDLYALADLAVLPSWYKEGGYPRALLEPMAMGKPVIAGDTDDCRSPVEHGKNGYLVPVGDAPALAASIAAVMMNDSRRKAFGEYSLRKARAEYDDRIVIRLVLERLGTRVAEAPAEPGLGATREDLHEAIS